MSYELEAPERVKLGNSELMVPRIGLGCMSMTMGVYGPVTSSDTADAEKTLELAHSSGWNFLDTADVYGIGDNEKFIGRVLKGKLSEVVLATKFGFKFDKGVVCLDVSKKRASEALNASLERLGMDCVDLFYAHRVSPDIPIEDTVTAMKALVRDGKAKYIGLSEPSAESLRRAHRVHPITCVENEYSLWTRDAEKDIIPACRELGVALVAYSPLGRGYLTGNHKEIAELDPKDFRRNLPRLHEEVIDKNLETVKVVKEIAEMKNCTPGQVSLAWILSKGDDIFPIPGTKRPKYFVENCSAAGVKLSTNEVEALDAISSQVIGARYNDHLLSFVNN